MNMNTLTQKTSILRTVLARPSHRLTLLPRPSSRRNYAAHPPTLGPNSGGSRPILIILAAFFLALPGYYFLHSDRSAGAGRTAVVEARASADSHPSKEFRDPRDSGVKTLEQKRAKEAGEHVK